MQKKIFGDTIFEASQKNSDIVVVSTDSANRSGLTSFIDNFPERYFEVGIMEQAAVGYICGFCHHREDTYFLRPGPLRDRKTL